MWKNPLDDVYACIRRQYLSRLLSGADVPDVYVRNRRKYLTRLLSGADVPDVYASVIDARTWRVYVGCWCTRRLCMRNRRLNPTHLSSGAGALDVWTRRVYRRLPVYKEGSEVKQKVCEVVAEKSVWWSQAEMSGVDRSVE